MAGRLLALSNRIKVSRFVVPLGSAGAHQDSHDASLRQIIGNRDIVGYGINGQPGYMDRVDFPMPALRWKENTGDVLVSKV